MGLKSLNHTALKELFTTITSKKDLLESMRRKTFVVDFMQVIHPFVKLSIVWEKQMTCPRFPTREVIKELLDE